MRSHPHLRLVTAADLENDTDNTAGDPAPAPSAAAHDPPRWWRTLVVVTLRHGWLIPPLWPLLLFFTAWRKADVSRALWRMKGEIGWDGTPEFNLLVGFKRTFEHRGNDPAFWEICEKSIDATRVEILGLVATFDDEVDMQKFGTIARWIDWRCGGKSKNPLPPWLKAGSRYSRSRN